MPDLSTLTTLEDLAASGWRARLRCQLCRHEGDLDIEEVRRRRGNLNFTLHDLSSSLFWIHRVRCTNCGGRRPVEVTLLPPEPIDEPA